MNTEDTYNACVQSLQQTGRATTRDISTANRCMFLGIRKGFATTIEQETRELPHTYVIHWEKTENHGDESNVIELRPGYVPFRGSHTAVQDSPDAASTESAAGYSTSGETLPSRGTIQPISVEMARPDRFSRALAGFAAGAVASAACAGILSTHGWTNLILGMSLPLIGAMLGVLSCER